MTGRAALAVVIALAALLVAGGALAVALSGRPAPGTSPYGAARDVPAQGPGDMLVELSADAAAHRFGPVVAVQLQRHFAAINTRNYELWRETVVPERAESLPKPQWEQAYRSTQDGTIRIDRIDDGPGDTLLVRVRFVSTQELADAPADLPAERICWRSTMPMSEPRGDSPPRIELTQAGSSAREAC